MAEYLRWLVYPKLQNIINYADTLLAEFKRVGQRGALVSFQVSRLLSPTGL